MSKLEVKEITPISGETDLTLGQSGGTVTLATGATAVGFGGGGKVLQVVKGANSASFSTTSSSLINTNITVTITPSSASSIILLSYNAYYTRSGSGSGDGSISNRDITRDGTTIFSAFGGTSRSNEADNGFIYDAPNTTSPVTYRLRIARHDTYTAQIPAGCYMTAMEIAG